MNGKKTYAVSILMVLHALSAYWLGHDTQLNVQEILSGLGLSALRAGVAKLAQDKNPLSLAGALLAFGVVCAGPLQAQQEPPIVPLEPPHPSNPLYGHDWIAPEPPLPGTTWYDYGWDSTSNGPTPAVAVTAAPRPMQYAANAGVRLAQAQRTPPPPGPMPPVPTARAKVESASGFYAESFLGWGTQDFSNGDWGYGVGVGYQFSKHWSADVRLSHGGLDVEDNLVQQYGLRLVASMPFERLAPYTFLGGEFDDRNDEWYLTPGFGTRLNFTRALYLFGETNLRASLEGQSSYQARFGLGFNFR